MKKDPYQLRNLADRNQYATIKTELAARLKKDLIETKDPRILGKGRELDDYARKYQECL